MPRFLVMRLLLVEEPNDDRKALRAVLAAETTFDLVGEACSAQEALELVADLRPRAVLIAPTLPDMSGAEAAAELLRRFPQIQIIALTSGDPDPFAIREMVVAGACATLSLRRRPLALSVDGGS